MIRNSGYCWGRVEWSDGEVEEVETARDYYDHEDGTAAKAFERKLRRQ